MGSGGTLLGTRITNNVDTDPGDCFTEIRKSTICGSADLRTSNDKITATFDFTYKFLNFEHSFTTSVGCRKSEKSSSHGGVLDSH